MRPRESSLGPAHLTSLLSFLVHALSLVCLLALVPSHLSASLCSTWNKAPCSSSRDLLFIIAADHRPPYGKSPFFAMRAPGFSRTTPPGLLFPHSIPDPAACSLNSHHTWTMSGRIPLTPPFYLIEPHRALSSPYGDKGQPLFGSLRQALSLPHRCLTRVGSASPVKSAIMGAQRGMQSVGVLFPRNLQVLIVRDRC